MMRLRSLRSGNATIDAFCADKVRTAAVGLDVTSQPAASGPPAHDAVERDPVATWWSWVSISAKGRKGTAELIKIIGNADDDRVPAAAPVQVSLFLLVNMKPSQQRLEPSRSTSTPGIDPVKTAAGSRRYPALARLWPPLWSLRVGDWTAFSSGRNTAGGLDWAGAATAFDGRQGSSQERDLEAGQSVLAMASHRRRYGRHPLCASAWHKAALVSSPDGAPSAQGCGRGAGEQDRPDGLGHHGARRTI